MKLQEPYRLTQWRLPAPHSGGRLFTCARPGRSKGTKAKVSDKQVHEWVCGLPAGNLVLVSLLGQKKDGRSEWSFYSFHRDGRTFQDWLDCNCQGRAIKVIEFHTIDEQEVPSDVLTNVRDAVLMHVADHHTVVLMDSGGWVRVRQVCAHLDAARK
jgi:hypothetical protein